MKEIVTRTFEVMKARIKVIKLTKDLVEIVEEYNHDDVYGWERGKRIAVSREEIEAAAELLGITGKAGEGEIS